MRGGLRGVVREALDAVNAPRPHYAPLFESATHGSRLADLRGHDARWFWALLLTKCDPWGRYTAKPRVLYKEVWALFGEANDVAPLLDDLERVGLIRRYEVGGEPFLCMPDWEEKAGLVGQRERRKPSQYPEPPVATPRNPSQGDARGSHARARCSGSCTADAHAPEEGERREGGTTSEVEEWVLAFTECPALNRPECLAAYRRWLDYRTERRLGAWQIRTVRACLKKLAPFGHAAFVACVDESISNGWSGVFPPKGGLVGPKDSMRARFAAESARQETDPPVEVEHENIR